MADREVSIGFRADVSGFMSGVSAMRTGARGLIAELESAQKRDPLGRFTAGGLKAQKALTDVGTAAGKVGLAAGVGFGLAVAAAARFDAGMSRVAAATHESAGNMALLRSAAIKAGQDTQYSATEAADAITEMAKAGVSTQDILRGGLTGALNLAAAGEMAVADAAETAATTMNQFGLAGDQVGHIADVLAATAGKAQGEVSDMALALKYVGPVASQMGVSLEETAGTIGELASQGILGSQAGTSLRGMLMSLTSPSEVAAKTMEQLGINVYDAQGKFIGFSGVAGQLHKAMGDLTAAERDEAFGRMFGNQQITAARILYQGGTGAVKAWTSQVDDSGYAAETAATKMDNLQGDLERLKGSLETALIGTGSGAQGPLRSIVQGLEDVVNAYNKLPSPAQGGVAGVLGLAALAGGGVFALSRVAVSMAETRAAMQQLQAEAPKTAGALRGLTKGFTVAAVIMGLDAVASALSDAIEASDDAAPSLDRLSRTLTHLGQESYFAGLRDELGDVPAALDAVNSRTGNLLATTQKFNDSIPGLGGYLKFFTNVEDQLSGGNLQSLREAEATFTNLDQALTQLASNKGPAFAERAFRQLARSYGIVGSEQNQLMAQLPQFRDLLNDTSGQTQKFGDKVFKNVLGLGGATRGLGAAASDATHDIEALNGALESLMGFFDRRAALRSYREALDGFGNTLKENGANFNRMTAKGRETEASLDGVATSALKVAEHMRRADKVKFLRGTANDIESTARRLGVLSNKDIQGVITKLRETARTKADPKVEPKGIPEANRALDGTKKKVGDVDKAKASPQVRAEVAAALNALQSVINRIAGIHDKSVTIRTTEIHTTMSQHVSNAGGRARGGSITGPGTKTSDSIPAWLSNGEYVMRAAAVDKYGLGFMHKVNAGHFAGGGPIGTHARTERSDRDTHEMARQGKEHNKHLKHQVSILQKMLRKSEELNQQVQENFRVDPFGDNFTLQGVIASLQSDTARADDFSAAAKNARRLGLSGPVLQALMASGNTAVLQDITSTNDVAALERAWRQRNNATADMTFGALTSGKYAGDSLAELRHELQRLRRQLKRQGRDVRDGARQGTREGTRDRDRRRKRAVRTAARR